MVVIVMDIVGEGDGFCATSKKIKISIVKQELELFR